MNNNNTDKNSRYLNSALSQGHNVQFKSEMTRAEKYDNDTRSDLDPRLVTAPAVILIQVSNVTVVAAYHTAMYKLMNAT